MHVCRSVAKRALTNFVPLFCFSFSPLFIFIFAFPSISIDVGATNGVYLLFPNGFLLCDHGLDFLDKLAIQTRMAMNDQD